MLNFTLVLIGYQNYHVEFTIVNSRIKMSFIIIFQIENVLKYYFKKNGTKINLILKYLKLK